jgi:hypothetical protein
LLLDLLPHDKLARATCQKLEDSKGLGRKLYAAALAMQFLSVRVDLKLAKADFLPRRPWHFDTQ